MKEIQNYVSSHTEYTFIKTMNNAKHYPPTQSFLKNIEIVLIINITKDEKENIKQLFESLLYFSVFELTRKASEDMYLLIINKGIINKAQDEADNLLQKICGQCQSIPNKNLLERKKRPLIHNQVSSYATALSQNTS